MLATAKTLSEAAPPLLLLSLADGAALERNQLELRLQLAAPTHSATLEAKSRDVLNRFQRLLKRDLALLAAMEAVCQEPAAENLAAEAARIAGFDAFAVLDDERPARTDALPPFTTDPRLILRELVAAVSRRLTALDLESMVTLSHQVSVAMGAPERGHELWSLADRLTSVVLRLQSDVGERFAEAARLYRHGQLEISEIGRLLGWAPERVAYEFERFGVTRTVETLTMTADARAARLDRIAASTHVPSASLARRDAVASQRIEGIDARAHISTRE